jgi:hypothetical protein
MQTPTPTQPQVSPVDAARVAIWRLFEEGYVDEDMATAGLLAVDLGMRRTQHVHAEPAGLHTGRQDHSVATGRLRSDSTLVRPRRAQLGLRVEEAGVGRGVV